jgi:ABC-type nitrate/sulfonate/bicarbonate transport system ATPase subunit
MTVSGDRIFLSGVSKAFLSREGEIVPALEKVSFGVPQGAIISLLGPTGCGKSTVLRVIAGLEEPDEGKGGLVPGRNGAGETTAALLTQRHTLFPWLTAEKNIGLPLEIRGEEKGKAAAFTGEIMETLELAGYGGLYPFEMSGGMQQRAALGRLLATKNDCWLLDEPFAALDERTRHSMQNLLVRLAGERGLTVLFVTHSIDEAVSVSDRIHIFSAVPGRIVETVDLHDPRPRDRLSENFGAKMETIRRVLEREIR